MGLRLPLIRCAMLAAMPHDRSWSHAGANP
jgi:hypothetical protein